MSNCTNCTTTDLAPYTAGTWETRQVLHFARRTGFGLTFNELQAAVAQNPQTYIQNKLNQIDSFSNIPPEFYTEWSYGDFGCYNDSSAPGSTSEQDCPDKYALFIAHNPDWNRVQDIGVSHTYAFDTLAALHDGDWVARMHTQGLKQKMVLFWSNHFVTGIGVRRIINQGMVHVYYRTLEQYAFGNFKEFTRDIGKTIAMLKYLDGTNNTATNINENYARELFELFTLGENNGYTQNDIEQAAKAFTGWQFSVHDSPLVASFIDYQHFGGNKTVFGQPIARPLDQADMEYDDVIDILFEQRSDEIATFICTEIYKFFIGHNVVDSIIDEMKTTFLNSNFADCNVLRW